MTPFMSTDQGNVGFSVHDPFKIAYTKKVQNFISKEEW